MATLSANGHLGLLALVLLAGCGPMDDADAEVDLERVGEAASPLAAYCKANVIGHGQLDVETNYLPHVVHCENGGAPFEALKAQAIAARTYLYYKLETSGQIDDGQNDQVYSCGSGPTALQKKAVEDTAGQVLRHSGVTLCSFYVAGDATLNPPACIGNDADAATEKYVTYNDGLSGNAVHPSTLGSAASPRNRGCMSQWGSRCLASSGRGSKKILEFYYGADVDIVTATGACVGTDSDGDGVVDATDNCPNIANGGQVDTDGDGKGDKCDGDDDGDGVPDGQDNCPKVVNAGQLDTDGDGKGDKCDGDDDDDGDPDAQDNCPKVANPGQVDTDGDGKGDKCDADDDDDGVPDADDNCRTVKNPGQKDADGDGKGDACVDDDDGDGVLDAADLCPNVADPEQEDLDADGEGDACDADDDGDAVADADDDCPLLANPDQLDVNADGTGDACQDDADGDGMPDVSDNCPAFDNPDQEDEDGDGVGDACADSDDDGIPDVTDDCASTPNPGQEDEDKDGIGDACAADEPSPDAGGDDGAAPPSETLTRLDGGCAVGAGERSPRSATALAGLALALAFAGRRRRGVARPIRAAR